MKLYVALPTNRVTFQFEAQDLRPDVTYVVASNHQSALDPFVELASFSFPMYAKLGPIRSMTLNKYLDAPVTRFFAVRMGCFPARAHAWLPSGIEFSQELIGAKQTVFICPEGRRTLPGTPSAARPGVAKLAALPNVEIIPAHIEWKRRNFFRRSFKLTMGRPFAARGLSAQQILDRVYDLPV